MYATPGSGLSAARIRAERVRSVNSDLAVMQAESARRREAAQAARLMANPNRRDAAGRLRNSKGRFVKV